MDFIYLRSYAFNGKLLILPVDDNDRKNSVQLLDNCDMSIKMDIFKTNLYIKHYLYIII